MKVHFITEAVWPSIESSVEHFCATRPSREKTKLLAGMNFQIILGAACFLEGVLETILRALLDQRKWVFFEAELEEFEKRKANNSYYHRVHADLSARIGRSTGMTGYGEMFELISGIKISELSELKPLLEGMSILFHFRNVLGHGREVSATQFERGAGIDEEFSGSYQKVEAYLLKSNLLNRRFVDVHSEYIFLGSGIADHFWNLAKKIPDAIVTSFPAIEREACEKQLVKHRSENPVA